MLVDKPDLIRYLRDTLDEIGMSPVPVALLVSPQLLEKFKKRESEQGMVVPDGLYILTGLPVHVDQTLTGDQYRVKYNQPCADDLVVHNERG